LTAFTAICNKIKFVELYLCYVSLKMLQTNTFFNFIFCFIIIIFFTVYSWESWVSFALGRSKAESSKDHNKATAITTKLQHSNALICFTEHTLKRIENSLYCQSVGLCDTEICIIQRLSENKIILLFNKSIECWKFSLLHDFADD